MALENLGGEEIDSAAFVGMLLPWSFRTCFRIGLISPGRQGQFVRSRPGIG